MNQWDYGYDPHDITLDTALNFNVVWWIKNTYEGAAFLKWYKAYHQTPPPGFLRDKMERTRKLLWLFGAVHGKFTNSDMDYYLNLRYPWSDSVGIDIHESHIQTVRRQWMIRIRKNESTYKRMCARKDALPRILMGLGRKHQLRYDEFLPDAISSTEYIKAVEVMVGRIVAYNVPVICAIRFSHPAVPPERKLPTVNESRAANIQEYVKKRRAAKAAEKNKTCEVETCETEPEQPPREEYRRRVVRLDRSVADAIRDFETMSYDDAIAKIDGYTIEDVYLHLNDPWARFDAAMLNMAEELLERLKEDDREIVYLLDAKLDNVAIEYYMRHRGWDGFLDPVILGGKITNLGECYDWLKSQAPTSYEMLQRFKGPRYEDLFTVTMVTCCEKNIKTHQCGVPGINQVAYELSQILYKLYKRGIRLGDKIWNEYVMNWHW